jgi:uncharacterized membrane protein YdfJ with MMPL/SSD domain
VATTNGFVARWRWAILACWAGAAALLVALAPPSNPAAGEASNFLPPDAPYSQAIAAFERDFPASDSLSEIVVIFERSGRALRREDLEAIRRFAQQIPYPPGRIEGADIEAGPGLPKGVLDDISVLAPADIPALLEPNPLISPLSSSGQAALVRVSVPSSFITIRSARVVDHVRRLLSQTPLPPNLQVAVTGSSGFGHDYAAAAELSHRRTVYVTIIAVAAILLLVYRWCPSAWRRSSPPRS